MGNLRILFHAHCEKVSTKFCKIYLANMLPKVCQPNMPKHVGKTCLNFEIYLCLHATKYRIKVNRENELFWMSINKKEKLTQIIIHF
jgi:hypothetical protein